MPSADGSPGADSRRSLTCSIFIATKLAIKNVTRAKRRTDSGKEREVWGSQGAGIVRKILKCLRDTLKDWRCVFGKERRCLILYRLLSFEQKKEEKNLTAQNLIKYNVYYGKS